MNEIIDNEFGAVKNFLSKYKNALMIVVLLIILSIGLFVLNFYNKKVMNEEAAVIYNEWLNTTSLENKEQEKIDSLYSDLTDNYASTGYAMMAMLSKGADLASKGDFDKSIAVFTNLQEISSGFGGNDFFNKISRISLSRIYIEIGKYDDALSQLSVYSESSANAYIHELIGDIFAAKQEVEKSIEQYMLADEKYDDQQSKSIIAMKIADLES